MLCLLCLLDPLDLHSQMISCGLERTGDQHPCVTSTSARVKCQISLQRMNEEIKDSWFLYWPSSLKFKPWLPILKNGGCYAMIATLPMLKKMNEVMKSGGLKFLPFVMMSPCSMRGSLLKTAWQPYSFCYVFFCMIIIVLLHY